jgi:predicted DNA-binding WGR domain protein
VFRLFLSQLINRDHEVMNNAVLIGAFTAVLGSILVSLGTGREVLSPTPAMTARQCRSGAPADNRAVPPPGRARPWAGGAIWRPRRRCRTGATAGSRNVDVGGDRNKAAVSCPAMAFLTRTDLTRNINRFYVVDITSTLFGEWAVLREWGRRGSPGTLRLDSFRAREEAQSAEQRTIKRRLQHGYTAI